MRVEKTKSGKPVVHGSPSSYNNHKCRCAECKNAWRIYMVPRIKAHRKKKREEKAKNGVQFHL